MQILLNMFYLALSEFDNNVVLQVFPLTLTEFQIFIYSWLVVIASILTLVYAGLRITVWFFPQLGKYRVLPDENVQEIPGKREITGATITLLYQLIKHLRPEFFKAIVERGQQIIANGMHEQDVFAFLVNKDDRLSEIGLALQNASLIGLDIVEELEQLKANGK